MKSEISCAVIENQAQNISMPSELFSEVNGGERVMPISRGLAFYAIEVQLLRIRCHQNHLV
jgi:hypothetical protein